MPAKELRGLVPASGWQLGHQEMEAVLPRQSLCSQAPPGDKSRVTLNTPHPCWSPVQTQGRVCGSARETAILLLP